MRIVKRQHPASVAGIVIVKNSKAFDRLLSAEATAPYVEGNFCIHLPWITKVVRIEDQGLPFRVENPAKGALALAIAVPVVHVDDVEIARDHKVSNVTSSCGKLFLLPK